MSENLQLLKRRIKTSKSVSQIAKAMEMMSASKIKKAQKTVEGNKPYAKRLELLTSQLIKNAKESRFAHPYIDGNTSLKKLLVVVSPDRGLCGSLNTNLFKALLPLESKNTTVITIGKKAEAFVVKSDFELLASFAMGSTIPSYSTVYELMRLIDELYKTEKIGTVDILYTEFKSFFAQTPVIHRVLPIDTTTLEEENGTYHIYEPGADLLLESLLPQYLEAALYSALLEAHTSEQVARMIAMQNAKNNANEIATFLTLAYNKSRQERITNEILDLSNNQVAV